MVASVLLAVVSTVLAATQAAQRADGAIVMTSLEQLHELSPQMDKMLQMTDDAYVFEGNDGTVKAVTDAALTEQLKKMAAGIFSDDDDDFESQEEEAPTSPTSPLDTRDLERRFCSHPPCFQGPICRQYTDCYSCLPRGPGAVRGRCV